MFRAATDSSLFSEILLIMIITFNFFLFSPGYLGIDMVTCVVFNVIQMEASTPASSQRLLTASCIYQCGTTMKR